MSSQQCNDVPLGVGRAMTGFGVLLPMFLILGVVLLWPPQENQDEFDRILEQFHKVNELKQRLDLVESPNVSDRNPAPSRDSSSAAVPVESQPMDDEVVTPDADVNTDSADEDVIEEDMPADTEVDDELENDSADEAELDDDEAEDDDEDDDECWLSELHPEVRLILLVLLTGALGSYIHMASSFVDYIGNRRLRRSWIAWYFLRPCSGSVLALIFYFCIRGGFLSPQSEFENINVFGILAIAGLAGLFSKQASDKLEEIFNTMFKTEKDSERRNKLSANTPEITGLLPASVTAGSADLELTLVGTYFDPNSLVRFDGDNLAPNQREGSTKLTCQVKAESLAAPRTVKVVVLNPEERGGVSAPVLFRIFGKPRIRLLVPEKAPVGTTPFTLTIKGENFVDESIVDMDGKIIEPTSHSRSKLVIELPPGELSTARTAKIKVINGTNRGGESDAVDFKVN